MKRKEMRQPRELPVLFNASMVLATKQGRKTQTRRPVKDQKRFDNYQEYFLPDSDCFCIVFNGYHSGGGECITRATLAEHFCPLGKPGDVLWVRETFSFSEYDERIWYWADGNIAEFDCTKPKPSIHMPRFASRTNLKVLDVRIQRLQDITEQDAIAEGLACLSKDGGRTWKYGIPDRDGLPGKDNLGWDWKDWGCTARFAYAKLWDSIYRNQDGLSWAENPLVWRVEYKIHSTRLESENVSS